MNNKVIIYLVTSAFMLMNSSISLVLAADSTAEQLGIQVETNGTFIMQDIWKTKENTDKRIKDFSKPATYKINLKLIKEFENNGKIIAHFEGEKSTKINDKINTYGSINPSHTKTQQETDIIAMRIAELYYQQTLLDNKFTISFGKLSLGSYFAGNNYANDETSQFLTGSFTTDKAIDAPSQTIALALNYAATDSFDIAYAYFMKNTDNFDRNGFNILQVTYKSSKNGNYRLYGWLNNDKKYSNYKIPNKKSGTWGLGISIDEAITEEIGVFARAGYNRIKKSGDEFRDNIISLLWNTGIQIKGSIWSRADDVIGLAVGQIYDSKGLKAEKISYKDNAETQIELYYKFALNNHIAISPIVQYFINPNAEKSSSNILVYGIRTSFAF